MHVHSLKRVLPRGQVEHNLRKALPVEPPMKFALAAGLVILCILSSARASAESLRCNGHSATEGDSRLSVLYKCGEPILKDSYCASVYYGQMFYPVPEPIAITLLPCQPVEEWVYDRGPGNLMATVRIRFGVVQSIHYGRVPR
jgi:hypothetical protein